MMVIAGAGQWALPNDRGARYVEQFRRPHFSIGTYSLRAGADDPQSPHHEDEVYVVTAGSGRLTSGGRTVSVTVGDVVFVPAGDRHYFHDITEDLALLVFFGPAYGTQAGS